MTAPSTPRSAAEATLAAVRTFLLGIFLLGALGTTAELVLIEHYEELWQLSPLVLLGAGVLAAGWQLRRGDRASVRALRLLMLLYLASGVVGVILHVQGNVEFEREMEPTIGGLALAWEALRGATPALAPGTMIQLGLVGLAATFRHPAARRHAGGARPGDGRCGWNGQPATSLELQRQPNEQPVTERQLNEQPATERQLNEQPAAREAQRS